MVFENLHVANPNWVGGPQFDAADDPVPVPLRVFGDRVRPGSDRDFIRVVDADGQRVPAGRQCAQVVQVRRRQAVLRADRLAVDPDVRLPVAAFEQQFDSFAGPLLRNVEISLIPRFPFVSYDAGQLPDGRLNGSDAETVLFARAGKRYGFGQPRIEPATVGSPVFGIERETPCSGERLYGLLGEARMDGQ